LSTTQPIAEWLEKLGLGQYAQRFAENDIDFALLTKLTDANLKELGVTSLGHRMRLLEPSRNVQRLQPRLPSRSRKLRTLPSAAKLP
jgi:SAM domain (Sterile alpha motif)